MRPNHLAHRGHTIRQRQRIVVALRQVEVSVGVNAPAEGEVVLGEEAEVVLREQAELEDRHGDGLQRAAHADLGVPRVRAVTVMLYGVMMPRSPWYGPAEIVVPVAASAAGLPCASAVKLILVARTAARFDEGEAGEVRRGRRQAGDLEPRSARSPAVKQPDRSTSTAPTPRARPRRLASDRGRSRLHAGPQRWP